MEQTFEPELFPDEASNDAGMNDTDESADKTYDFEPLFEKLATSDFRRKFSLKRVDREYIISKGMDTIRHHAEDFVRKRLAPAMIPNDGKQTPMRGHPVFIAQHATACCCRSCLMKWHGIPAGRELTQAEREYVHEVLMRWIADECGRDG